MLALTVTLYAEHRGNVVWLNVNASLCMLCLLTTSLLQNLAMPTPYPDKDSNASSYNTGSYPNKSAAVVPTSARASVPAAMAQEDDDHDDMDGNSENSDQEELLPRKDDPEAGSSKASSNKDTSVSDSPEEETEEASESEDESSSEESSA